MPDHESPLHSDPPPTPSVGEEAVKLNTLPLHPQLIQPGASPPPAPPVRERVEKPAQEPAPKPAASSPEVPKLPAGETQNAVEPAAPPPEPRKPPEWKILEPVDRSDPTEHEMFDMKSPREGWSIVGASIRGKLHAHQGLWRDDHFSFGWVENWTILVVSDGAGSARISRIGAQIACEAAVKTLQELLSGYRLGASDGDMPAHADLLRIRTFLSEGARKAQVGIFREAQRRKCPPKDLNATLLLVVHGPWNDRDFVGAIQIGDGAVGLFQEDDTCTVLGVADHGEYSSETRFLTTPGIEFEFDQRTRFCCRKGVRCLAVMCDGVSDDFFPEDQRLIELFIGNPIQILKTKSGDPVHGVMKKVVKQPEGGKALLDWLRYEKKQSSDDRTLVLMYRSELP